MILSFTLSMPSNNSWNGKWTGEDNLYVKVVNFGKTKKGEKWAKEILDEGSFCYHFGDGWVAGIEVNEVDGAKSRQLRSKSKGFCGYDWMVDSIRLYGDIRT